MNRLSIFLFCALVNHAVFAQPILTIDGVSYTERDFIQDNTHTTNSEQSTTLISNHIWSKLVEYYAHHHNLSVAHNDVILINEHLFDQLSKIINTMENQSSNRDSDQELNNLRMMRDWGIQNNPEAANMLKAQARTLGLKWYVESHLYKKYGGKVVAGAEGLVPLEAYHSMFSQYLNSESIFISTRYVDHILSSTFNENGYMAVEQQLATDFYETPWWRRDLN
ncbi:MAG: hypothetical protein OEZ58_18280 [Gammaproteobacteria bacterium]|nr:hypothetical protein [Gammaproteobacteria bacterium]